MDISLPSKHLNSYMYVYVRIFVVLNYRMSQAETFMKMVPVAYRTLSLSMKKIRCDCLPVNQTAATRPLSHDIRKKFHLHTTHRKTDHFKFLISLANLILKYMKYASH